MTDFAELFLRVRDRAGQQVAGPLVGLGPREVGEAERALGFVLPPVLRGLYRSVANGGFGPEYCLLPLIGAERCAVGEYEAFRTGSSACWPRGVLPILDWGCGMYAAVDCLVPGAPVLLFEPNAVGDDWADAWFKDSPTLARWLLSWLDGTGWWEEDDVTDEEAVYLGPWPDAGQRLLGLGGISPSSERC